MNNKTKIFSLIALLLASTNLHAQVPSSTTHLIDMSAVLGYVLILYTITFIALGLLIMKLVRPALKMRWLYIFCILGVLLAAATTWAFKDVQDQQLPEVENTELNPEDMSPENYQIYRQRKKEVQQQQFANFWIIAIPNVVILILGIFADRNYRRRDPDKPRGRYD